MQLLSVDLQEAARYMGIPVGAVDAGTAKLLEQAEKAVCDGTIQPKYTYRVARIRRNGEGLYIGDIPVPFEGEDIKRHLEGCPEAVLFAATLTAEADKKIARANYSEIPAFQLAVSAVCSAATEQVCDLAEEEIFSQIKAPYRTWRFSPGYGDLPLSLQSAILDHLNASRRIGLTVTEECLLIPTKSVTAIIGISDKPVNSGKRGCESCNMRSGCAFTASGKKCARN